MGLSKRVLLATCGTALVLLVSLGPQAWAAPWHNPHRQTVPTITPERGGDEDDGDGDNGGDVQPTAGPEVVPSPTGISAWPSPTTTVSSSVATPVSPDSTQPVPPPAPSPVSPSPAAVTTVPPTPMPVPPSSTPTNTPVPPSPPPSNTPVAPSPTPLVTAVPGPVPAATHSPSLMMALSGLAATNAGRVLIVGIMLILVGGALLLGRPQ